MKKKKKINGRKCNAKFSVFCYVSFLFYYIYDSLMQPKEKKMNFTHTHTNKTYNHK